MQMDFIVDKQTKTVSITKEFAPSFHWFGTHIPNRNFLTSGGRQNPGRHEQRLWTSRSEDGDFMQW